MAVNSLSRQQLQFKCVIYQYISLYRLVGWLAGFSSASMQTAQTNRASSSLYKARYRWIRACYTCLQSSWWFWCGASHWLRCVVVVTMMAKRAIIYVYICMYIYKIPNVFRCMSVIMMWLRWNSFIIIMELSHGCCAGWQLKKRVPTTATQQSNFLYFFPSNNFDPNISTYVVHLSTMRHKPICRGYFILLTVTITTSPKT